MARGKRVEAGQSLPATVPDNGSLRNNLFPGQDVTLDGNRSLAEGAIALQRDAWTKSQLVLAKNAAIESEANAKVAVAKARVADAEARVADAEADAKVRVAEAQAATKVRVATAESLEVDLKIVKLRKELEVLTGESQGQGVVVFSVCPSVSLPVSHYLFSD